MWPWERATPQAISDRICDFNWYRERFLMIRPREGGRRIHFILNPAQEILHQRIELERKTYGRVRALVPKARRMGVSTYISARFFHAVLSKRGRRAHVVAHRNDSASHLHREVRTFYEELPEPIRPVTGASNARELIFSRLQSSYRVSSAEGGNIGRSEDTHYLHFSEAAFFDNTEDLSSGILQTVLDQVGTEIFMESTGNGASGMFFNMCEQAHRENNTGLWRMHFLPWTAMVDYKEEVPDKWQPPLELVEYSRIHRLTPPQTYWFYRKNYDIATMNGGTPDSIHRLTRQEFPVTYSECFLADSTLDFFPPSLVQQAMLSRVPPTEGTLKILAVDPAGDGSDSTFVCDRQGCCIGNRIWGEIKNSDQNVQADWIRAAYERYDMDVICIDSTGIGKGLVDALRLRMRDRGNRIIPVSFGSGAHNSVQFANRRAELHFKFAQYLNGSVSVKNDKMLQEECAAYKWGTAGCRRDEHARLFVTPKEKIRAEIGRSPDRLDAVICTFAVNDYDTPR